MLSHSLNVDSEAGYYSFMPSNSPQVGSQASLSINAPSLPQLHDVHGEEYDIDYSEETFSSLVKRERDKLESSNLTTQCSEGEYSPFSSIGMDIKLDFDSPPKPRKGVYTSVKAKRSTAIASDTTPSFVAAGTLRNISLPPVEHHVIMRRRLPERSHASSTQHEAREKPVSLVGVRLEKLTKPGPVEEPQRTPTPRSESRKEAPTNSQKLVINDSATVAKRTVNDKGERPLEDLSTTGSTVRSERSATSMSVIEVQWAELTSVLNWAMDTKNELVRELCSAKTELHDNVDELTELLTKFRKMNLAFIVCLKRLSEDGSTPELAKHLLAALMKRQHLLFQTMEYRIKTHNAGSSAGRQECPFNVCQSSEGVRWLVERYLLGNLDERLRDMYLFIGALSLQLDDDSLVIEEMKKSLTSDAKAHSEMIMRRQAMQYWNTFVNEYSQRSSMKQGLAVPSRTTDVDGFEGNPGIEQMHSLAIQLSDASTVAVDKVLASLASVCQLALSVVDAETMLENAEKVVLETTNKMLQLLDENTAFQPANLNFLTTIAGCDHRD